MVHLRKLRCSFCEKEQKEVKYLIAGPREYICEECIELCRSIVWSQGGRPEGMVMLKVVDIAIVIVDEVNSAEYPFLVEATDPQVWQRFCGLLSKAVAPNGVILLRQLLAEEKKQVAARSEEKKKLEALLDEAICRVAVLQTKLRAAEGKT